MLKKFVVALSLFGAATAAQAATVQCSVVKDAVNVYYSAHFDYTIPEGVDPLFLDMHPMRQADDFEAYVRSHYGVSGEVNSACTVVIEGAMEFDGDKTFYGTTMHYVQTGYTPKGG